ncbi:MAG: alpha/beta hydrolase [Bryobacteraceae bacterium]|jgi:pimeloyl-ACP methyl ester carboxylesterase
MKDEKQAETIPGFTSNMANVNGVRLHYLLGGNPDGPPVLLWHGFLSTSYAWRKVMPALATAGLAVLVPDMRGYGDSDKPDGTDGYDARALAEELRALVRKIGFGAGRPLALVAHDMGAPPALLWAADHPEEVAGLLYIEVPVMLSEVLTKIIAYTPEAMKEGSMWWWILPLAPDIPERLIVGNERAFLTWFYERHATPSAIDTVAVNEYLRTFSGREGVLGALGVYRAAFATMEQTAALTRNKVQVPVVALGGERAQGLEIRKMVEMVANNVGGGSIAECGHFVPEERPDEVFRYILAMLRIPPSSSS